MDVARSPLLASDTVAAKRVRLARDRFLAGRDADLAHVRPVIVESWRRSRTCGVDPGTAAAPIVCAADERKDGDARRTLRAAAAPVLRFLDGVLRDHSFVLLLTDRHCRPVDVLGTTAVLDECERINVVPGSEWAEHTVGTDAVALSTRLEEPIQVHWSENYAALGERWTGNSAPIHDPATGALLGVLSLYGFEGLAHPNALEVTTDAALMIEQRLKQVEQRRRIQLFERYTQHLSRHADDPAVCITRAGIVVALSPSASDWLRVSAPEANGRALLDLPGVRISRPLAFDEISDPCDVEIARGDDRRPAALLPVERNAQIAGFILRLRAGGTQRPAKPASPWRALHDFSDVVGESAATRRVLREARLAAERDATVLIVGETGTGKELLAHSIHAASERASGPFVPLNCGGMTDELLASELFGYDEGAFTGAARGGRTGKLELADGGTLFLDEVEAMSSRMQVALLRFLEDRRVLRVGGTRPRSVDVRIVAATNVALEESIARGEFRKDLFYRLNELPLRIPPLRERREDLPAIIREILRRERIEREPDALALERLARHDWPGNVRELRNVLLQAACRATGERIRTEDLPLDADEAPRAGAMRNGPAKRNGLASAEREALVAALRGANGNLAVAASELGIHRVTLYRKLKRHGIQRDYR